jgi:hypothetical protein
MLNSSRNHRRRPSQSVLPAPGDYKLIAVDDDQPVAWRSADYRQQGKSVRVTEGETQRLDVGSN